MLGFERWYIAISFQHLIVISKSVSFSNVPSRKCQNTRIQYSKEIVCFYRKGMTPICRSHTHLFSDHCHDFDPWMLFLNDDIIYLSMLRIVGLI